MVPYGSEPWRCAPQPPPYAHPTGIRLDLCSAYKDETGLVIMDRQQIASKYLRGFFFIDLFSMVPMLSILVQFGAWDLEDTSFLKLLRIVRLLRLSKLIRLVRTSKMVQQLEAERAINYSLAQLYGCVSVSPQTLPVCVWLFCCVRGVASARRRQFRRRPRRRRPAAGCCSRPWRVVEREGVEL